MQGNAIHMWQCWELLLGLSVSITLTHSSTPKMNVFIIVCRMKNQFVRLSLV